LIAEIQRARHPWNPSSLALQAATRPKSGENKTEFSQLAEIIRDSVRTGLTKLVGTEAAESILYIIELDFGINMASILDEVVDFRVALYEMFGSSALTIEDRICLELASRIGVNGQDRSLVELVSFAREYIFQTENSNDGGKKSQKC
jgi:hypothetical protein